MNVYFFYLRRNDCPGPRISDAQPGPAADAVRPGSRRVRVSRYQGPRGDAAPRPTAPAGGFRRGTVNERLHHGLEDGSKNGMMKRYLMRKFSPTRDDRARSGLPQAYPITASRYSEANKRENRPATGRLWETAFSAARLPRRSAGCRVAGWPSRPKYEVSAPGDRQREDGESPVRCRNSRSRAARPGAVF